MKQFNLRILQNEHARWLGYNFPRTSADEQFLGVVEEVGELSHAILKQSQGIRGNSEKHDEEMRDAVGDIVIFLLGFCTMKGMYLDEVIADTWEEVSQRDWQKNKKDGY